MYVRIPSAGVEMATYNNVEASRKNVFLRHASNLLFGTARIYQQQVYFLYGNLSFFYVKYLIFGT